MKFHPLSELFPLMQGREFDELVADLKANGLRVPIVLHIDGSILDGRNRYRACEAAGVEPRYTLWDGVGLAADFVWSLNGPRRHLEGGALQIAAGKYAVAREAEAKERQGARTDLTSSPIGDEVDFGRSVEKAAEKFGIGRGTVERAVKVVKEGAPELVDAVEAGFVSVSAAADVAELPKPQQREIVARGADEILQKAKEIRAERAAEVRERNDAKRRESVERWFLIDLHVWRADIQRDAWRAAKKLPQRHSMELQLIPNNDGTHFAAFDVRSFPRELLIACSHDVPYERAA